MSSEVVEVRGASLHNLKNIDLDLPLGKLVAIVGVSGSGKSTFAMDTLFAEGQRRFIESFSSQSRRFLKKIEKPDFAKLDPIPATVAITRPNVSSSSRMTVGSFTEIDDYLRLLLSKMGQLVCLQCQRSLRMDSADTIADWIRSQPTDAKLMITFPIVWEDRQDLSSQLEKLQSDGLFRVVIENKSFHLANDDRQQMANITPDAGSAWVIVDRITGGMEGSRITESIQTALSNSPQRIAVLSTQLSAENPTMDIDSRSFATHWFGSDRRCVHCEIDYPFPQPSLFSKTSLGGCEICEGKGIRKKDQTCTECQGTGYHPHALAYRLQGWTIADMTLRSLEDLHHHLQDGCLPLGTHHPQASVAGPLLQDLMRRTGFVVHMGLGHLSSSRLASTLSTGELQRLSLTIAMGSTLTQVLYVVDEPTACLHPSEANVTIESLRQLQQRGNSVLVITHDHQLIAQADWIIELGPGAGDRGGQIQFHGPTQDFLAIRNRQDQIDGDEQRNESKKRKPHAWMSVGGLECHNMHQLDVQIPLGVLCLLCGVSGSGKSTLLEKGLFPLLRKHLSHERIQQPQSGTITGIDALDEVVLIGPSDASRTSRSIPATSLKVMDDLRDVFAATTDARVRNFDASFFSFNHPQGRCPTCQGSCMQEIDMQFLADIQMECTDCKGTRFQRDVLQVCYRDRNIADVLEMSIQQAIPFFRGLPKIQKKLQPLIDVGLGYIQLGQPGNQLSQGESQRVRLAAAFGSNKKNSTLFLIDEPTAGLHDRDVNVLLSYFDSLLSAGHSLMVIDHHPQLWERADYILEMGPGSGQAGGKIIAQGTPDQIANTAHSRTASWYRHR